MFGEFRDRIQQGVPDISTGELPLGVAARTGNALALRALLEAGAKVDAKDRNGKTALQMSRTVRELQNIHKPQVTSLFRSPAARRVHVL